MKLFPRSIRKLSACLCCFGGFHDIGDLAPVGNDFELTQPCSTGPCQLPNIGVQEFLQSNATLFPPLLEEQQLCESIHLQMVRNPLVAAASRGDLKLVKLLFKESLLTNCFFNEEAISQACICAAAHGHLKVLKFFIVKVFPEHSTLFDQVTLRSCCITASAHGHFNVLKYLFAKVLPAFPGVVNWDLLTSCSILASAKGHLNVLKFLLEDAFPRALLFVDSCFLDSCSILAACNGHVKVLKFLFLKAIPKVSFFVDPRTFNNCFICASNNSQLNVLHFLIKLAKSKSHWYLGATCKLPCQGRNFGLFDFEQGSDFGLFDFDQSSNFGLFDFERPSYPLSIKSNR